MEVYLKIVKNTSSVAFRGILGLSQTALVAKKSCPVYLTSISQTAKSVKRKVWIAGSGALELKGRRAAPVKARLGIFKAYVQVDIYYCLTNGDLILLL